MKIKKLKASSLYFSLVISLLVSVFIGGILVIIQYDFVIQKVFEDDERLDRNLQSIFTIARNSNTVLKDKETLDLYGEERDSVELEFQNWGAFQVAKVKSFNRFDTVKMAALLGSVPNEFDSIALLVTRQNAPLTIVGETDITGDVILSRAGVKRGYIGEKGFNAEQLINGSIIKVDRNMPDIDEEFLYFLSLFNSKEFNNDLFYLKPYEELKGDFTNSFYNPTVVIWSNKDLNLAGVNISGNVIILTLGKITVRVGSNLENVILFGNEIHFKGPFVGNVQAFALSILKLEGSVELQFPSVVGTFSTETESHLEMNRGLVEGVLFSLSNNKNSSVLIGKNAKVHGQIFSQTKLQLEGQVSGGCFTNTFFLKTPSSVYSNHLLDVTISREKRSPYMTTSLIASEKVGKRPIIKWLN